MRTLIRRLKDIAHRGRPALVARRPVEPEAQGASLAYGAELEQMKTAKRDPLTEWLEDIKTETALRAEERQIARENVEHFDEAVKPAYVRMRAMVDEVLGGFMAKYGITWDEVEAHPVDVAATEVIEAVGGDIHELNEQLKTEVALSTPTGEYPVVRELVAA
ncbi:MAG TPA: hypothetical protein VF484_03135 [Candidatus Limnocylindrales bacterium]